MKIILTGFKPFDQMHFNPSEWLCTRLDGQRIGNTQIQTKVFDVLWNQTYEELKSILLEKPELLLMMGVARTRPVLNLEMVGLNLRDDKEDNSGEIPSHPQVIKDGPNALFSDLPIQELIQKYQGPIPLERSLSAGAYLCNQLLYQALFLKNEMKLKTQIGFLHVPFLEESDLLKLQVSVEKLLENLI